MGAEELGWLELARASSNEIDAPTDVITGPVPVMTINRARGYAKRVLAKRCALRIGMAGTSRTSPAMTNQCERDMLQPRIRRAGLIPAIRGYLHLWTAGW